MSSDYLTEVLDVAGLPPIGLQELISAADLPRRFDDKFVVPTEQLPELIAAWSGRMRVLEVDGRRATDYQSTYFDTPDLRTYRDHVQRRRRRFKIRSRHYGDPAAAMLEVKLKGRDRQTIKYRRPHPGDDCTQLTSEALAFVADTLEQAYDLAAPEPLSAVASTMFARTTLADLEAGERITIDRGLVVESGGQRIELGAEHAVLETKSPVRRGTAMRELTSMGFRPDQVSKYCLGIVASRDDIRGNPWIPVLRRMTSAVDW